jgi:hypothetical protein
MEQVREAPKNPYVFAQMPHNKVAGRVLASHFSATISRGFCHHRKGVPKFGPSSARLRSLTALGILDPAFASLRTTLAGAG